MLKLLLSVAITLVTAGCASYHGGTDLSSVDSTPILVNQTTQQELITLFGHPQHTTTGSDGRTLLTWWDSKSHANAFSGSTVKARTLTVTIVNGVVVDFKKTDTDTATQKSG